MSTRTFSTGVDVVFTGTVQDRGGQALVSISTGASTAGGIPNYGISLIAATSSEPYTLATPLPGLRKTLVCTSSSTTITPLVRGSTAQTVTFAVPGANTNVTMFRFAATRSTGLVSVVELIGQTSLQWIISSVFPIMTTGAGGGTITLSTT